MFTPGRLILPEPSNATPPIVLDVAIFDAVSALPVTSPVNTAAVDAPSFRLRTIVSLTPSADVFFLIFSPSVCFVLNAVLIVPA